MSDAQSLEPPLRLKDRYQLVEWQGEGGMATVYRAHDETLDRDVAIKFFAPGRVVGEEASARFLREARAVARLSHPNIMALYDVGREGLWHYLVLEHIPGKDLHALMVERGGPLPLHEALHAMRGVLAALAYAHAQGLVHRDIKPENVMVTPSGAVKVADFGLALAQGDVRLTKEDTIVGTLLYLAPEAISGGPPDHRADLYAVGAVLYELLTGQPPFAGDHSLGVISQILHQPLTPPRRLDPRIPAAVEQVVVRLLARDPANRYASAEEALAALPDPAQAGSLAAEEATDEGEAGREPLSLLERIVRSSSAALQRPEAAVVADEAPAESLAAEALLVYAAREDTAAAVEAERRRLARLLQGNVAEAINLLLSQASVYEQTLGGNPQARMAVSVLTTLARQLLQQVRDLEATLHPTVLETLGLEPALEALASQTTRAHGLHITLHVARMPERLSPTLELALFRAAQDALERAVHQAQASQVMIRLARQGEELRFSLSDNGVPHLGAEALRAARQRLEQLGGTVKTGISADGGFELTVRFRLEAPAALTPRELDVLQLLAEGLSNKQIAGALYISPSTVNFHLENIYAKLAVNSRTEAAIYALRHGLVHRPPDQA